jgi:hypothetical protein
MSDVNPADIDPMTRFTRMSADDRISTMGSCFAQHMSRHIGKSGLRYFVPEQPSAALSVDELFRRNYGVYSARYGNIYTARQGLQLFQRAFGEFVPTDVVWRRDGCLVDAFRPRIEPGGFSGVDEVETERAAHLASVRRVFLESEWLVFTLGLTECWRSRRDGAVYPLAPGVAGGTYDPARYEFVNFSVRETVDDLSRLIAGVTAKNPNVRFLLTVSPVPLNATFEERHVLSSTVYSKSVLRAAADEMERQFKNVIYFPAYEIVTSPAAEGRYFLDDLRGVSPLGVDHVMRVFRKHFIGDQDAGATKTSLAARARMFDPKIVCDEEEITQSIQGSENA